MCVVDVYIIRFGRVKLNKYRIYAFHETHQKVHKQNVHNMSSTIDNLWYYFRNKF